MRTGRGKIAEQGNVLARLRASDAGPDPHFRAVLRERLVAAAGDRSGDRFGKDPFDEDPFSEDPFDEDPFGHGHHDLGGRNRGRADGRGERDG
ncbi:hypothetical protein E1281_11105 [Actinomadura sp. KC345]|uniref:hypothetical protein n=1 Tax=Actinomadura sp. KC345 TaxID=2530371 RepID=UPI00104A0345|nr:hypothetical protein [Actinomadura sp. KC345]TDC55716.1 hypothetical protein E1281_11105 [Actinomadura sp. KC345]